MKKAQMPDTHDVHMGYSRTQEDHKFEASLNYTQALFQNKTQPKTQTQQKILRCLRLALRLC